MLGAHREFGGRRASQGTREGDEQTRRNDGKAKHEEEHVGPTLDTGNRLKISIEEFSWEKEDDGSTMETEKHKQQELVYITNLEDGLRKNGTKLYDEEGPDEKKPAARNRLIEEPPLNDPNHVFEVYKESGSDVNYIEDSLKGEDKKNSKETTTLIWMWKRKESKPTYKNRK